MSNSAQKVKIWLGGCRSVEEGGGAVEVKEMTNGELLTAHRSIAANTSQWEVVMAAETELLRRLEHGQGAQPGAFRAESSLSPVNEHESVIGKEKTTMKYNVYLPITEVEADSFEDAANRVELIVAEITAAPINGSTAFVCNSKGVCRIVCEGDEVPPPAAPPEQPQGSEPKICACGVDLESVPHPHASESAGLADRGEPQVTVQIVPQWMVRFTYWDGVTTSDGFQCDSPEEAQRHIDRLVKKNLAKAADPAQGQPEYEIPELSALERAELNELRKDAGLPYDEKWAPTLPEERAAQGQMSARELESVVYDAVVKTQHLSNLHQVARGIAKDIAEAFARSQGEKKNG